LRDERRRTHCLCDQTTAGTIMTRLSDHNGRADVADITPAGLSRRAMLRGLSSTALLPLASVPALAAAAADTPDGGYVCPAPAPTFRSRAALDYKPALLDPLTDLKTLLSVGLGKIPYVGAILSVLVELLWPTNQADLWSQIKDKVAALIDDKIQTFYQNELQQLLDGLHGAVGDYLLAVKQLAGATSPADKQQAQDQIRGFARSVQTQFTTLVPKFTGASADTAWKVLPLYVQVANLHFGFLSDFLKNSAAYGNEPSVVNEYHAIWMQVTDAKNGYPAYVDTTLVQAAQAFESERKKRAANIEHVYNPDATADQDAIATGAWWGQRDFNAKNNEYTVLVRDFRELWKSQQDPTLPASGGARPALTRELWYGPYGAPSLLGDQGPDQISAIYRTSGGYRGVDSLDPPAQVAAPPATPAGKLSYISGVGRNFYRHNHDNHWDFPCVLLLTRDGQPVDTRPGYFGISLADQWGGPVTQIAVHIGKYRDTVSGFGVGITESYGGYLVSALQLVQKRDPTALHMIGANDSHGYEMKEYHTETWAAPDGHELCNVFVPTWVNALWIDVGHPGLKSVGSIMFSCRLSDPSLKPTPRQLAMFYVVSPVKPSAADLASFWAGVEETPVASAELVAEIGEHIDLYQLDQYRDFFWAQFKPQNAQP